MIYMERVMYILKKRTGILKSAVNIHISMLIFIRGSHTQQQDI